MYVLKVNFFLFLKKITRTVAYWRRRTTIHQKLLSFPPWRNKINKFAMKKLTPGIFKMLVLETTHRIHTPSFQHFLNETGNTRRTRQQR